MSRARPDLFYLHLQVLCQDRRASDGERGVERPNRYALHLAQSRLKQMTGLQVIELLQQHRGLMEYLYSGGRSIP